MEKLANSSDKPGKIGKFNNKAWQNKQFGKKLGKICKF